MTESITVQPGLDEIADANVLGPVDWIVVEFPGSRLFENAADTEGSLRAGPPSAARSSFNAWLSANLRTLASWAFVIVGPVEIVRGVVAATGS